MAGWPPSPSSGRGGATRLGQHQKTVHLKGVLKVSSPLTRGIDGILLPEVALLQPTDLTSNRRFNGEQGDAGGYAVNVGPPDQLASNPRGQARVLGYLRDRRHEVRTRAVKAKPLVRLLLGLQECGKRRLTVSVEVAAGQLLGQRDARLGRRGCLGGRRLAGRREAELGETVVVA